MMRTLATFVLLHSASALLVPLPPQAPLVRTELVRTAHAASYPSYPSSSIPCPAGSSTLIAEEAKVSPAKAKIEAAKVAQQQKLAQRGYGELAAPVVAKPKAAAPVGVKTFAEQLDAAVQQRESITGSLSPEELETMEKKVRAAFPGLQ